MTCNFEVSSTTSSPSLFTSYISPHGCVSASVKPMKTISCDLLFCRRSEVSTVIITQYCLQAQRPLSGYGNITSASPGRCCSTIGTFCQYWRLYKLVIFGNCDWQCRYGKNGHFIKKNSEPYQLFRINLAGANPGILGSDHLPGLGDQQEHHSANSHLGKMSQESETIPL